VQAAFDGDTSTATSFWWNGTAPSEAETAAFVEAANAKYGRFEGVVFNENSESEAGFGQSDFAMPFIFKFSKGSFDGEVFFSASQQGEMTASGSYLGIDKIVIKDPDDGDLVWAAGTAAATEPVTSAADEAGTEAPAKQEEAASPADS
jgi:hypothetical protein